MHCVLSVPLIRWTGQTRQLHCPHLTWQAVTVRSDRLVPGLFICCWWERSWGEQIAFAQGETAITALKCEHLCVYVCVRRLTSSLATGRTSCTYLCQGKIKICVWILFIDDKFMLFVVRPRRAGDLSSSLGSRVLTGQQAGECLSCSLPGSHRLSAEMWCTGLQGLPCPCCTSSVTQRPCSAWLPDSCPLLQKQPYIIGQLCPLRLWQTKPTESIKP